MRTGREILMNTLEIHGHRCRASVACVRVGLAALRVLNVKRSGGRQLHAFIEIGEGKDFVLCAACHELTARAYLRVVGDKHVCIPCSGYER